MSFLERLGEISKPKQASAKFDFGFGDGEETLYFRSLSYNERKKIFSDRTEVIGKDKDGRDIYGIPNKLLFEFNAETLATSWVKEDGKSVATKDALMQWDGELIDRLAKLARETVDAIGGGKESTDGNPSQP